MYNLNMLILSGSFTNKKILSIRSNLQVAELLSPIINPNNLKIVAFYVRELKTKKILVLLTQDIRENHQSGIYINDAEELVEEKELVRLKQITALNFILIGKPVQTLSGEKLGKVNDYALEDSSLIIIKLYVSKSIVRSFSGMGLTVDRNQIIEITPSKIIIEDILEKVPASAPASNIA